MEKQEEKIHVVVIPFHSQGHINPMLHFSKRLAYKGLKVTLISTLSETTTKTSQTQVGPVMIQAMPFTSKEASMDKYFELYQAFVVKGLHEFILKYDATDTGDPIRGIIYDSFLPLVRDVAEQLGLVGAPFFTQSCTVGVILNNFRTQEGVVMPNDQSAMAAGLPQMGSGDLPSIISDTNSNPSLLNLLINQFSNFEKNDWIFFNTVKSLEEEVVNWMESKWAIKTIGPTIPSMYLDKRLPNDKDYGLNLFKPNIVECMQWLDTKENGSVVYVSLGSLAALGEEHMKELAWGLRRSESNFLWVVRESEMEKLPVNFVDETLKKGLIVSWCPQLDVLSHNAIGCFVTHCGWNSTLEALSLGVPMVGMPQLADQPTNAKFVADVWKVGVRVHGIGKQEEIETCIREVMDQGERRKEIQMNAAKWKKLAKEAMDEGGSSDNNIEEFVKYLLARNLT